MSAKFHRVWLFLAAVGFLGSWGNVRGAENASVILALESISVDQLRRHVDVLADDTFEGREAGSRGGRAAGVYLGKEFQKYGLAGAGSGSGYYQNFGNQYRNILGLLEGSDAELKNQIILVSAHYDHVGYGNATNSYGPTGYIHNGADDNASGTAGLLETIEAFTKLEPKPKRSLLFALWDAEEKGLLGSKHWLVQPTLPLKRVRFMVNLDMIGRFRRNRGLDMLGSRTSYGLRRMVSLQNERTGLPLIFDWEMTGNSDHYPFFEREIPVLMLHTGLHEDYHRPSDDAEKIGVEAMQQATRLLFAVANQLANQPEAPAFRRASRRETPSEQRRLERAAAPVGARLGIQWDPQRLESGIHVTSVTSGSAADRGGLRSGDKIVRFADQAIDGKSKFAAIVLAARNPVSVVVQRPGAEEPVQLELELSGSPVRLGIAWQTDEADPASVFLVRVIPGSLAADAGLRVLDRIYQVQGKSFSGQEQFQEMVTTLPLPIELQIERGGRIQMVQIESPP